MKTTNYRGIDYGGGVTNIDRWTGLRFGVIPSHDLGEFWMDSSQPDYGDPHCPECGGRLTDCDERVPCPHCNVVIRDSADCYPEDPIAWRYEEGGYEMSQDSSGDVWILKSPYYTHAQYCSPCAPGACHLGNPLETAHPDNACYCPGHDWFEGGRAPFPVYSVATAKEIQPEN